MMTKNNSTKLWQSADKLMYTLFHKKPNPLRQGRNGQFIFIHINKTAGTSVGKAIGLPVKHHLTAQDVIRKIGRNKWDQAFKFTFVRNPWDKVVSLYEYRRKKDRTMIASQGISFADWVRLAYSENDPDFFNVKSFQQQVDWLKDPDGKISIDFIGRFESISEDFDHIRHVIGVDAKLPFLNATQRRGYHSYYDDESKNTVAKWFHEDIELFGYKFESR